MIGNKHKTIDEVARYRIFIRKNNFVKQYLNKKPALPAEWKSGVENATVFHTELLANRMAQEYLGAKVEAFIPGKGL